MRRRGRVRRRRGEPAKGRGRARRRPPTHPQIALPRPGNAMIPRRAAFRAVPLGRHRGRSRSEAFGGAVAAGSRLSDGPSAASPRDRRPRSGPSAVSPWDRRLGSGCCSVLPCRARGRVVRGAPARREREVAGGVDAVARAWGKPVVLTEIGYTTRRDPAVRPREWPDGMKDVVIDVTSLWANAPTTPLCCGLPGGGGRRCGGAGRLPSTAERLPDEVVVVGFEHEGGKARRRAQ